MKRVWTKEMIEVLKDAYPYCRLDEISEAFGVSESAIKTKAHHLKLKKAPGFAYASNKTWTLEEDQFLITHYPTMTERQLSNALGKTISSISNRRAVLKLSKEENKGYFHKGGTSFNKGKKQAEFMSSESIERTKATRFQKGHMPPNTLYDYAVTQRTDSHGNTYLFIRLAKAKWDLLHRWMWICSHGNIPKGHVVAFKDGNHANCQLDNLEMITMEDNMRRNTIHNLLAQAPDLKAAFFANIALKSAITRLIKKRSGESHKKNSKTSNFKQFKFN
jgi:hypothetical protein